MAKNVEVLVDVKITKDETKQLQKNLEESNKLVEELAGNFDDLANAQKKAGAGASKATDKLNDSLKTTQKESKKTSESIQDVTGNGGAIAILDQLTGGLATRFRDAFEATKLFNLSLKGTRTALIATGIGALVVALGAVVAYWDDIVDLINQTNEGLESQLALTKGIQDNLSSQITLLDKQIDLNNAQGKGSEELQKQKLALLDLSKEQNEAEVGILKTQLARLKSTSTEVSFWDSIVGSVKYVAFGANAAQAEATKLAAERLLAIKQLEKAITDAEIKGKDLELTLFNINNPKSSGDGDDSNKRTKVEGLGSLKSEGLTEDAQEIVNAQLRANALETIYKDSNDLIAESDKALTDILLESSRARIKISNLEKETKEENLQAINSGLQLATSVLGESTVAGKLAAVALATVNTYSAIAGQLATFSQPGSPPIPGYAIAQAVATGAFGLLNVRKILAVKTPNIGGGGGGGGASLPSSTAIPAPSFNVVGDTGTNQLNDAINERNSEPARAYVVYEDISTAEQLEQNAIQSTRIG